MDMRWLITIKV